MSELLLIENGAPTLANLKTASLFTVPAEGREAVENWKRILAGKGVMLTILREREGRLLVYIYRERRLRQDLSHPEARCILCREGYRWETLQEALETLKQRLGKGEGFPHEIGLFLGYPPEDVQGFIQHRGRNCKCTGCWKVYGDEQQAVRQFARFKKCRDIYLRLFCDGRSLTQLTVAS